MRARLAFLCLAAVLLAGPAGAQVARLERYGPPDTLRVGRPFSVLLTVRPPAGAFPLLPVPPAGARRDSAALRIGDAVVVGFERRPPAFVSGNRIDSALYSVSVFDLDSVRVGPITVRLVAGGDTATVSAAAITVVAVPVSAPADTLRPPAPPLPLPRAWGPAALAVSGLIGTLFVAARWLRRPRRPAAARSRHAHLPPYEEAVARLDALDAHPIRNAEDVEAHHEELADTLRTFFERSLGLDAHRLTTSDLLGRLAGAGVSELARDRTATVLRETDLVKFAARRPDAAVLAEARRRAREVLEALRPAPTGPSE